MDSQSLQLLLLTLFAMVGFFLFVVLLAFLQLDKLILQPQRALHVAKQQLQEAAPMAAPGRLPAETVYSMALPIKEGGPIKPIEALVGRIARVPFPLLQAATAHFSERHLLAHAGGSARIFVASLSRDQLVAIKRFEPAPITSPRFDPFFNELLIHTSISAQFKALAKSFHSHSDQQTKLKLHHHPTIDSLTPSLTYSHAHQVSSTHALMSSPPSPLPPCHHYRCAHHHLQVHPLALPSFHPFPQSQTQHSSSSTSTSTSRVMSSSIETSSQPYLQQDSSKSSCRDTYTCSSIPHRCLRQHQSQCFYFISLLGYCLQEQDRFLVYEYAPNRDLSMALTSSKLSWRAKHDNSFTMQIDDANPCNVPTLLPWITRLKVAIQVAEALSFLHHSCQPPITHRDLKASSILLTRNFDVRLSSFNEAKTLNEGEFPLYDIYLYGKLLLHLILGSDISDGVQIKEFFESYPNVDCPSYDLSNNSSFFQFVDPSLMIEEDFAKEVLGVALLAKECIEVRATQSISMLTIARLLQDPTNILNKSF